MHLSTPRHSTHTHNINNTDRHIETSRVLEIVMAFFFSASGGILSALCTTSALRFMPRLAPIAMGEAGVTPPTPASIESPEAVSLKKRKKTS